MYCYILVKQGTFCTQKKATFSNNLIYLYEPQDNKNKQKKERERERKIEQDKVVFAC